MKLNLGCGQDYRDGWINIDVNDGFRVDLAHDLKDPLPYDDDSVWEILAKHVLEHISWCEVTILLRDWYRVLMPMGRVTIEAPNLLRYFEKLQSGEVPPQTFLHGVYGAREQYREHKGGLWPDLIRSYLEETGFTNINVDESIFMIATARKG